MITAIDAFSLEIMGQDRSRLQSNAKDTGLVVDGINLEAQFAVDAGYLLLTTHDVPYEELLHATLVGPELSVLDTVKLGGPYTPGILTDVVIAGPDAIEFSFFGGDRWILQIRQRRRCFLGHLLQLRVKR